MMAKQSTENCFIYLFVAINVWRCWEMMNVRHAELHSSKIIYFLFNKVHSKLASMAKWIHKSFIHLADGIQKIIKSIPVPSVVNTKLSQGEGDTRKWDSEKWENK